MRAFVLTLSLFLAACGGDVVGPFADWLWIAGQRDNVALTETGAVIDLGRYGSVWFTQRHDGMRPGTRANIAADFRSDCVGIVGQLWAGIVPGRLDKRQRLDSAVLGVSDTYVPPTFYYQVVAMNSSPQNCRLVVRGLTAFEEMQ